MIYNDKNSSGKIIFFVGNSVKFWVEFLGVSVVKIYAMSFLAASISSDTNIFTSVPCMEQARDMGSLPKAGHVKQLAPKCFEKTSFVEGHLVVTSPVVIAGVIFNSDI